MSRVTIAEVAALAGVSAMTVSNVLNDRAGASDATRARVHEAVRTLGYVPNLSARGLKSGRTGLVGVIVHDLTSQYALEITRGIADKLAELEIELLISATYQDASRELQRVELLSQGMVDGVIMIAPALEGATVEALTRMGRPVVVVDPRKFDCAFPHIVVDNYAGTRTATEYLVEAGHRQIAMIAGDNEFDSSWQRRAGFTDALRLAGIDPGVFPIEEAAFTYEAGLRAMNRILERASRPTAVVTGSDLIAFGAIAAVRSAHLNVPDDISVVGFDDLPQAADSYPGVTTVRQPLHEMGVLAVNVLTTIRERGNPTQPRMELKTELVKRGTVGPPLEAWA